MASKTNLLTEQSGSQTENELMVARGKAEKGLWEGQVHTAVFKTDNWKRPTVEHGELCSMLCARLDG